MGKCIYIDIHKDDDTYEKQKCNNCQEIKCIEHQFAKNQKWCCNCKNTIKEPENELPEKCNWLETIKNKKVGKWCNNDIIKNNKCIKHCEKEITGCNKITTTKQCVNIYCNKEKLENTDFCEKHNKEPEQKKCSKCDIVLTTENKSSKGNKCKPCINKYNQEKLKEIKNELISNNITHKVCINCNKEKSLEKFKTVKHDKCRDCSQIIKNITKEEYLQIHGNEIKKCLLCENDKIITDFSWHTNNFRNQCKKCIGAFQYYIEWRIRKRLQDPEEFKKHNNEIHRLWIEKNKEKFDNYMKVFINSKEGIISTYLSSAKIKNLLTINEDDFKNMIELLIIQNCFYCGKQIKEGNLQERIIGDYNGVDRINSNKPYILENCVPCCKKCNIMKNTLDIASFLRKNVEISLYNNLNDNINKTFEKRLKYHNTFSLIGSSCDIYMYKKKAKERKKDFELTKEQFNEIVKQNCYLCGGNNSKGIGIDRFDSNIGYILENCKPCCSYCNYMKNNLEYNDFLKQVKNIVNYSITEKHYSLCNIAKLNRLLNNKKYLEENEEDNDIFDYLN